MFYKLGAAYIVSTSEAHLACECPAQVSGSFRVLKCDKLCRPFDSLIET